MKLKKKEHLQRWRDKDKLKEAIINDHEEQVSLHLDHGMDCNLNFKDMSEKLPQIPDAKSQNRNNWTPMHFAAENGSLNVIIAIVSRGANIDPQDDF